MTDKEDDDALRELFSSLRGEEHIATDRRKTTQERFLTAIAADRTAQARYAETPYAPLCGDIAAGIVETIYAQGENGFALQITELEEKQKALRKALNNDDTAFEKTMGEIREIVNTVLSKPREPGRSF